MASNLEVIIGTYEQFLLGYKVEQVIFRNVINILSILPFFTAYLQNDGKYSMHQSFAVHAHIASVRSVHAKGKYLASGGADDRIYVYDMKKRQEVQVIILDFSQIDQH